MYLAKENVRIDSIGYLERTFVQQKLSLDFEDTSYKGIRHAGPLKMSVQTSFDYLMGSSFVHLQEVQTSKGIVLFLMILYLVNVFIILTLEWFIFHGA